MTEENPERLHILSILLYRKQMMKKHEFRLKPELWHLLNGVPLKRIIKLRQNKDMLMKLELLWWCCKCLEILEMEHEHLALSSIFINNPCNFPLFPLWNRSVHYM